MHMVNSHTNTTQLLSLVGVLPTMSRVVRRWPHILEKFEVIALQPQ